MAVSRYTDRTYDEAYEVEEEEETEEVSPGFSPSSEEPTSSPDEYGNSGVSPEVKELFSYISRFRPVAVPLVDASLRPFIPDYVPAVGDVDAFLKVPRPDGKVDRLGVTRLDEPRAAESDGALLTLQLKKALKVDVLEEVEDKSSVGVRRLHQAHQHPEEINKWIEDVNKMHADLPLPSIQYSRRMPDIDQLMQVWPIEVEAHLTAHPLSSYLTANMDLSTTQLAHLICALLDIPVFSNTIESLHVLFSLYAQVKTNQHYQASQLC